MNEGGKVQELSDEQAEVLQQLRQSNVKQLKNMSDNEILEGLKAIARPMFEVFLQDMKIEITNAGDDVNFQVHAHEVIGGIMQNAINSFCNLMRSYQTLYGNEETDVVVL